MDRTRWLKVWIRVVVLAGICLTLWVSTGQARDRKGWSEPVELAGGEAEILSPALVEDPFGNLQVFWVERHTGEDRLLTRSRRDGKWSDVLTLDERAQIGAPQPVVDASGVLHLLYEVDGVVLARRVEVTQSQTLTAWSSPTPIGRGTGNGALAMDAFGILRAVFTNPSGEGFLLYYSTDGQKWWMQNYPLPDGNGIQNMRMAFFPATGQMILVWEQQEQIFFAAQQSGEVWNLPVKINETPGVSPNLLADSNQLAVLWNGTASTRGRYFRALSLNGTWQPVENFSPAAGNGTAGAPQVGVDVNGVLHVLTADTGCIWYLTRTDQGWQRPFCFDEAQEVHHPVWVFDAQGLRAVYVIHNGTIQRLLFSEKLLDTPMKTTPLPIPATPTAVPSATPMPTASPTISPTPLPVQIQGEVADFSGKTDGGASSLAGPTRVLPTEISRQPTQPPSLLQIVLFGFLPTVIVVFLIVGVVLYKKSTL
ncbi:MULTISPECIES: hypothetical protein [Anaerolinea]|uniref:hypothetical protein n=1 Tax=Anaerolinea TaxID=233189 RepID=UPI002624A4DF|nr:hypothetical protein [Anaerolinea thermophila]